MSNKQNCRRQIIKQISLCLACFLLAIQPGKAQATDIATEEASDTFYHMTGESVRVGEVTPSLEGTGISAQLTHADTLITENEKLALYLDYSRMVIKIRDKANGFIWSSGADPEKISGLTPQWQAFSQSLLVAEYMTEAAPTTALMAPSYQPDGNSADVTLLNNGFRATLTFEQPCLQVDIIITLNEDGICVEIPDDSIRTTVPEGEKSKYVLSKLYVLPFLGAQESAADANGYIMIPDGCGALINFGEAGKYSMSFTGRVYGGDLGVVKEMVTLGDIPQVPSQKVQYPVFGIANGVGSNAFLAIIDQGDAYTEIIANPAGVRVDYFWACPKMVYREAYFQSTGKGNGFSAIQKSSNPVNAKIYYNFLNGEEADYVGMAKSYQSYLENRGLITRYDVQSENIPFLAEAMMAELENALFGYGVKEMTSLEDVRQWVTFLNEEGISNLIFSLKGFEKGGYSGGTIDSFELESKVGSERELQELYEEIKDLNGQLLLSKNFARGYEVQIPKRDLSYRIDHMLVSSQEQKAIFKEKLYTSAERIKTICESISGFQNYRRGLYLEDVGNTVVSDYHRNMEKTRQENLNTLLDGLQAADEATEYLVLEAPNAYALPFADAVAKVPVNNSRYLYAMTSVPFIPTVLSGYVPQFSQPLNFGTQTVNDILLLIDYNIYPTYIFTEKESAEFENTNTNDIYSSCFDDLKDYAVSNYQMLNQVLSQVQGQRIINREIPQNGVSVTEYENGKKVIVNYTDLPINLNGTMVDAYSATLVAA